MHFRRGYKGGRKSSDVTARPSTDAFLDGYDQIDWSDDGGRRLPVQTRADTRETWFKPSEQREREAAAAEARIKAQEQNG
jgi:hypothetical protein